MGRMTSKNVKAWMLQHRCYSRGALFLLVVTTLSVLYGLLRQQGQLAEHQNELNENRNQNAQLHEQAQFHEQQLFDQRNASYFTPDVPEEFDPEPVVQDNVPPAPFMWIPLGDNNQFEGLHVVITSFCLGQGQFLELVQARIMLFKKFCLPSMLAQETQSFLWLIYVDETLPPEVKEELEQLIGDRSNIKIVERSGGVINSSVNYPQLMNLEKQFRRAQLDYFGPERPNALIITTRLDADDALHRRSIQEIQTAAGGWMSDRSKNHNRAAFFCYVLGVAWQPSEQTEFGAFVLDEPNQREDGCLTPGLTMVTRRLEQRTVLAEGRPHDAPKFKNYTFNNIRKRLEERVTVFPPAISLKPLRWPEPGTSFEMPFRSRTVASNGMYKVDTAKSVRSTLVSTKLESGIYKTFAIGTEPLSEVNKFFIDNELAISRTHLKARCAETFVTCKFEAKNKLKAIRDTY